jgi:hypothetical protein
MYRASIYVQVTGNPAGQWMVRPAPWSRVAVPTLMNANAPEGSGNVSVFAAVAGKSIGYCTLDTCGGSTVGAAYDIDIVIEEL